MLMMQNLLGQQTALVSHSMFLALIGAIALGYVVDCRLDVQSRTISKVENRTNHHGWTKPTVPGVAKGKYALFSVNMSGSAMSLAGLQQRSKFLRETLCTITTFSGRRDVKITPELEEEGKRMQACAEVLERPRLMQEAQIDLLSSRVQIQLIVVSKSLGDCRMVTNTTCLSSSI